MPRLVIWTSLKLLKLSGDWQVLLSVFGDSYELLELNRLIGDSAAGINTDCSTGGAEWSEPFDENRSRMSRERGLPMAMRLNSLLLLLCVVVVCANGSKQLDNELRPCSSWRKYPITIKDVIITPEPVVSGEPVTFTVPAYANHELQGGTVVITVSFFGFKVYSERDDLCSKAQCPINGDFALSSSQELPPFTPPGPYKVKFQVVDSNGVEQACATVGFTIIWRPPQLVSKTAAAAVLRD